EAFLRIDGMHCSSCELLIEKHALKVPGVVAAKTNYATATVKIVYDPEQVNESDLPGLISRSGYNARFSQDKAPNYDYRMPMLRLVTGESLAATVMMLYLAFYYPLHLGLIDMTDLEPVRWLVHSAVPMALLLLTTVMIVYVAAPIFQGAWVGLRTGVLNMDNLLVIAILAAYGYSVGQLFIGTLSLYF
ncbi:MAG: cation transporter, partial [Arenicellales bacterium]|nr:cation transporter [Arenicellales bacterium]